MFVRHVEQTFAVYSRWIYEHLYPGKNTSRRMRVEYSQLKFQLSRLTFIYATAFLRRKIKLFRIFAIAYFNYNSAQKS